MKLRLYKTKPKVRRLFTLFIFFVVGVTALHAQVHAYFSTSFLYGCPPLVENFQDLSTGNPNTFFWDFDNGNTSILQNPTATFNNPGVYNVRHIVSDGVTVDTAVLQIRVFLPPSNNFNAPDNHGCIQPCHMVHFTNLTIPGESPVVQYVWDFGDGTLPQQGYNIDHCYLNTGSFNVTLISLDSNGCQTSKIIPNYVIIGNAPTVNVTAAPTQTCISPTTVNFTANASSNNGAVTYAWYFGDATTSAQQNPSHVYFNGIYDAVLVVTDPIGCQVYDTSHIAITDVHAGFVAPNRHACNGVPFQFIDTSNFAATWDWNFGDGAHSQVQNPLHTYTTNGTYTVTLTVTINGCTDTHTETAYIDVSNPVQFTMNATNTTGCAAPLTTNFTSNAPGASGYMWNFGDSTTSTLANPSHTYTANGTYLVTLGVVNAQGCVNTKTLSSDIFVGALVASFTVDTDKGCSPLTVNFTNTSTSNSAITNYHWIFGDGSSDAFTANPSHSYNFNGQFYPMLIVTNADGCKDTVVYSVIDVGGTLNPIFNAQPTTQCVDQPVSFFNQTQGAGPNTTYLWDFGDGSTSNQTNPTHQYSDTGYFDIKLTVINQGCKKDTIILHYIHIIVPKAQFDFKLSCSNPTAVTFIDSSQGADTYLWEFGDGTTSTLPNPPVHNYPSQSNYTITLIVTNNTTGCVDSTKRTLPIGTPQADLDADKKFGCFPLKVHFADSSVFASSWLWKFGDGTTSTQQNPIHIYADTGRYTVTLIINPTDSCSDSIVKVNYITVYGVKANFTATPVTGCAPMQVAFTDLSYSFLGIATAWSYHFGTGDSSHQKNPVYTYDTTGNYYVLLKVTDSHGCSAITYRLVQPRETLAKFISDTAICPGEPVHFTNTSLYANYYIWDFGDGQTSNLANPTHTYTSNGFYTVTLIAANTNLGCVDTLVKMNLMNIDTPVADFFVQSAFSPCPPFPVHFYNSTNRTDLHWLWYFGDGDTSTAYDPLHVYFYPGDYDVTLISWDSVIGCSDTMKKIAYIRVRGPLGNFVVTPDTGCVPVTISITGSVLRTVSIVADMGDGTVFTDTIAVSHTYTNVGVYYPIYTLTDSVGCTVPYAIDTIIVGLIPYPNLPPDTTVCKGNYVAFNLPYGDHFLWTSNPSTTYLTCDTCKNTVSQALDTLTYFVTAWTDIGCIAKDTITVNVDALPIIFPGLHYRICPSDTLQLNAGPGVATATWTPDIYINDTTIANPKVWPPDTMIYRVTGYNSTGCSISRIVKVWPITSVVSGIGTTDTLICEGVPVQLGVTVQEASFNDTTFQWSPSQYLNSGTVQYPVITAPPGDYHLQVVVRSSTCIADTDTVHVFIAPKPTIEAGDDKTVAAGTNIQLWVASHQSVNFTWTPAADSLSCIDCRRPYLTATQSQVIYVAAQNQYGCIAYDSVVIRIVQCDPNMIYVPNTFTPNNDDLNDKLFVRGIGLGNLDYFRVFDRWGRLMFETHSIGEGWDGTVNGKPADQATYVYVLRGICTNGDPVQKSGNVTLLR
jgi:gliding motility-associated-like protein